MMDQLTDQRIIIEMGMGNDQYGQDYTKAAGRAIEDAIRHSALAIFRSTGLEARDMRVVVTIGVQAPDQVDAEALKARLPYGMVEVRVQHGGLDSTNPETGNVIVIAAASVEVFLPSQSAHWRLVGR